MTVCTRHKADGAGESAETCFGTRPARANGTKVASCDGLCTKRPGSKERGGGVGAPPPDCGECLKTGPVIFGRKRVTVLMD